MPTIRPYKVIDEQTEAQDAFTIDLDLPSSGILSYIELWCTMETLTTGVSSSPFMNKLISSVSVNQAGQAFLNAAPPEAFQADYYYKTGKFPRRGYEITGNAADVKELIPIMFGESLDDIEHTVDLSRLNDPKISVTYDTATTDLAAQEIWGDGDYPRFTVIPHLIQGTGIPASKGYQSLRQVDQYTPANSEEHRLELKGGRPIKRLYTHLDKSDAGFGWLHCLDSVKVWGSNETYVPFLMKMDDWLQNIRQHFGLCNPQGSVYYSGDASYIDIMVDPRVYLGMRSRDSSVYSPLCGGGSGRSAYITWLANIAGGAAPNPLILDFDFYGICPWTIAVVDMEKMLGMEYLNPQDHAPMYLELDHVSNAEAIGGPVKIYVEDLVTTY